MGLAKKKLSIAPLEFGASGVMHASEYYLNAKVLIIPIFGASGVRRQSKKWP